MFKLVISNTVTVPMKGSMYDAEGKTVPFEFALICNRASADELAGDMKDQGDAPLTDYMAERTVGWNGVCDEKGAALTFTPENLAALLNVAGMATIAFRGFLIACGAKGKEKN